MRILIVAQYYPPDMGGGATRAQNAARGLVKAGCSVTVLTAFPHYPTGTIPDTYRGRLFALERDNDIPILRAFVPPIASAGFFKRLLLYVWFVFSSILALPRLLGRFDAVWASNPNLFSFFPGRLIGFLHGCPVLLNVDDLWPDELFDLGTSPQSFLGRLGQFVAKRVYALADGITPISPAYVPCLTEKYYTDPAKLQVIPAGVDLERFQAGEREEKPGDGTYRVLYIGAFSPAYDFHQVFRAAEKLGPEAPVEFILQGGGELAPSLRKTAQDMQLLNVRLVERIVSRDEVAMILAEADALLLPLNGVGSIEMGLSTKLYEYQAAGKPIICCSNGHPGRYVKETKSGVVVKPGDHEALARAVMRLSEDRESGLALGSAGRRWVEGNMSYERVGVMLKNAVEQAIARRKARR